jgi:peroxiredoxin
VAAAGGANGAAPNGSHVDLETLGPKTWLPSPAPEFALADTKDATVTLSSFRGKPVVLLFYLGNACTHCKDQLRAFAKEKKAFDDLGAAVLAVSADTPEANRAFLSGPDGPAIPFTLLSDPERKAAKLFGAHDTFEDIPLHGVVIVDSMGKVRWSRATAEPFTDVAFVLSETARMMKILEGRRKTRV